MKKHSLLAPLVTFLTFSNAATAQVEPRMVGEWHSADSNQSLVVQPNGRYQSKANGNVVDSGKITGTNGNWKLQSDSGRTDQGTFSFISGKMYLHGGLSGAWSHSPQAAQTTTASELQNLPRHSTSYSSTFGHGPNNELPGYTRKTIEEANIPATPETGALPPQKARKGFFSGAGSFAKTAASQWLNAPNNSNTANTPAQVSNRPRGDYVSPYWKDVNPGGHVNASDMNRAGSGMPANQTTEHWEQVQWQNKPASPGWQTVPRGGYIPVMKDGKARRYWGH